MQPSTEHNQFKETKQYRAQEIGKKKKEIREKGSQPLNLDSVMQHNSIYSSI